jgi:hypothetical protein
MAVMTSGGAGLQSIFFIDQNNGWAAGNTWDGNGKIIHTTNGGENWELQMTDPFSTFNSVYFTDQNNGWVVDYDLIIKTTDGGVHWISQSNGTGNNLESVYFIDQNTGWVVGYDGAILKTTTGGATFIEEEEIEEIPTSYVLSQNYPNPFNPSTKIKYSNPKRANVVIRVYDILGNEIETLVKEEKPAGTYEITWNAANLPSGVYFYQIKTGEFIQTKKMILLK